MCCRFFRHKRETELPEAVKSVREGRNPATGQEIDIPAKKSVQFKPAKELADKVNHWGAGNGRR